MKLIISGGTGFLASELIRQSLRMEEITSLVVLTRRALAPLDGADTTKLEQVILKDYETYPEDVRREFAGANACIWTVAITPTKSLSYKFEDVRRVCQTSTLAALGAMHESNPGRPFRFMYTSGHGIDPTSSLPYFKMRGDTETQVLGFAKTRPGEVEACVVRPALITSDVSIFRSMVSALVNFTAVPRITAQELATAMLQQVVGGFTQEIWTNNELNRRAAETLGASTE
ncbi:hypothetical protein HJFPF1_08075 [Paramyrothecium foliicola]|nr:hypothetical protein HJFPF1_08075 [Paramyrothecium foliicola]